MPSTSEKQRKFMAMCANGKKTTTKCPPKKVSKEFNQADKAKKR